MHAFYTSAMREVRVPEKTAETVDRSKRTQHNVVDYNILKVCIVLLWCFAKVLNHVPNIYYLT